MVLAVTGVDYEGLEPRNVTHVARRSNRHWLLDDRFRLRTHQATGPTIPAESHPTVSTGPSATDTTS
jgi:hypothetical protein